jgi:hypothetical protein
MWLRKFVTGRVININSLRSAFISYWWNKLNSNEKEILVAMKRLKKIDEEARKRLLQEKDKSLSSNNKKNKSLKMGSIIGKQKPNTLEAKPKIKMYCVVITTNGTQCSKYQVEGCNKMCKQHFENSKKDVVMKETKPVIKKTSKSEDPRPMIIENEEKSKPKKKEPIPAAIKTLVWNKWMGEKVAEGGCYACRVTSISMRHHHCGHVVSEKNGGKCTIDNLRPVCANCNLSMGTLNMNEYIEKFGLHK